MYICFRQVYSTSANNKMIYYLIGRDNFFRLKNHPLDSKQSKQSPLENVTSTSIKIIPPICYLSNPGHSHRKTKSKIQESKLMVFSKPIFSGPKTDKNGGKEEEFFLTRVVFGQEGEVAGEDELEEFNGPFVIVLVKYGSHLVCVQKGRVNQRLINID